MAFRTLLTILLAAVTTAGAFAAPGAAPAADERTLFLAHFDGAMDADAAKGSPAVEVHGAERVPEGKWGGAVRLGEGQYLSIDPKGNLDTVAGTLMFWVKPDWKPADGRSHALLSMGLDGDPPGYFVLSQGWWEQSGGAGRMYFVCDNQAFLHTSTPQLLALGERLNDWHHVALTWQEGKPGHCALYIDGEPAARNTRDCEKLRRPRTRLLIGSDAAAGMGGDRPADALFDELVIYDRAFAPSEVARAFQSQEPRWAEIQAQRNAWLTDVLKGPAPTPKRDAQGRVLESRAMLDESWNWADPARADEIVSRLKRAGFNVYVPCVWHGRGAHWPTPLEPPAPGIDKLIASLPRDPLAYLIERCHAEGIQVHPWFCVVKRERDLHPELCEERTPKGFFDAHRPEFRDWILRLMLDVVRRYPVDGINLDYIRTGGLCTGPKCAQEYQAKFGTTLVEDRKPVGAKAEPNPRLVQWQDEAIADIVRRLAEEGRRIRPGLVVSADVHVGVPGQRPATDGRNVVPWIRNGWLDVAYDMDYGRVLGFARIDAARAACGRPAAIVDLLGNYEVDEGGRVVPREGKLLADLASFCQRRWPGNGVGVYLLSMLNDDQTAALRAGPFKEDAVPHWER